MVGLLSQRCWQGFPSQSIPIGATSEHPEWGQMTLGQHMYQGLGALSRPLFPWPRQTFLEVVKKVEPGDGHNDNYGR